MVLNVSDHTVIPESHKIHPYLSINKEAKQKKALLKRPAAAGAVKTEESEHIHCPKKKAKLEAAGVPHALAMKAKKAEPKVKEEIVEVPQSKIMKAMPDVTSSTTNAKPVHYWGGVIYTSLKAKKFRALRVRGDVHTEKSANWGKSRTEIEAWKEAVNAINEHHKGEKQSNKK